MADITIAGASYSDVPAINVAQTGGGSVRFILEGGETMFLAAYGKSAYDEVLEAYKNNNIVYCRSSSNSNPSIGNQTRMAFLAYVNNEATPTEFEFQYYRSVATHSDSQQGDQVYVYKLNKNNGWSVTVRSAFTKVVAGTGLKSSYSNGTITISLDA